MTRRSLTAEHCREEPVVPQTFIENLAGPRVIGAGMKTFLFALAAALVFVASSQAGGFTFFVNAGGSVCAPRYNAPPPCYAPRIVSYYPAPVFYRSRVCYSPAVVYAAPTIVRAPAVCAPVYRAPVVTSGVTVAPVSFRWRR